MTARVNTTTGVFAGILVGTDELCGAAEYTMPGIVAGMADANEFGQPYDHQIPDGTFELGSIIVPNIIRDPTNAAQIALDAAILAGTGYGPDEIKFKRTATSYYTPSTGGLIYVTKIAEKSTKRKGAPETFGYEFKLTGAPMALHPALVSIAVSASGGMTLSGAGAVKQLIATATYSSGDPVDIATNCNWSTSAISKVAVTKTGLAVGISAGTSSMTAESLGINGVAVMTVS